MKPRIHSLRARRARGVTLIELMISMVLGLVIIGGATSMMLANRQSYRTNEALSQVQESARTAVELLSRDIREAGVTGCDSGGRVANVLRTEPPGPYWWQTWFGIMGFGGSEADGAVGFGTAVGQRVQGTAALHVQGMQGTGLTIASHQPSSATIKLSEQTDLIVDNDILMMCDFDHAAIFQVTNYNNNTTTLVHNSSQGQPHKPGNCSKGLGYPTECSPNVNANGNVYEFGRNAQIARLSAVAWYIGNNGRATEGGRSLYRQRLGAAAAAQTEEIVAGVSDMELWYREEGADEFVLATDVDIWSNVNAVKIELTMQSADQRVSAEVSVNSGRLERSFTNIVTLRNRVP
jgi:type IV pilus assembly protein PilW